MLCLVFGAIIVRSRKVSCVSYTSLLHGHANFLINLSLRYSETHSSNINFMCFSLWRFEPLPGHGFPLWGDHCLWTHHARYDSSGRAISPTQRTLLDNTQQSQEKNIHGPRRDSKQQFQKANVCRRTPQTARPPGSVYFNVYYFINSIIYNVFNPLCQATCFRNVVRILLNM